MWTLKLSRQAARFFESMTGKAKQQMAHAFDLLQKDPFSGKMLRGDLKGYWSFRVGMYRILYVVRQHEIVVEVLRIHHRKEVYERFRR